jgi:hypothetical protein
MRSASEYWSRVPANGNKGVTGYDGKIAWYDSPMPFEQMLRHIREDKCEQCRAVVLYLEIQAASDCFFFAAVNSESNTRLTVLVYLDCLVHKHRSGSVRME